MTLQIKEMKSTSELKEFIKFPFSLYKGNLYYVPPLINFELNTLLKEKNPAFDQADASYWVVEKDHKIVGRIAAIVLRAEQKEKKLGRFGWVDFVDDLEVSTLLFDTAEKWVKQRGAKGIHGPLGFSDLDFEGALTDGFDQMATQATIYNHPYYIQHYKNWGMKETASWIEMRGEVPTLQPRTIAKITKTASIVSSRYGLEVKKPKSKKELLNYARGVFNVLNESYKALYGYHQLSIKQIDYYINLYFGFVRKEYICIVVNKEDEVIGFSISLPSFSKAFQKAKGSLYPFGFLHVLRSFYLNRHVDFFLIGIIPKYQNQGAIMLIMEHMIKMCLKNKVNYITAGPALEDNHAVLNLWKDYSFKPKVRRSCFEKQF